MKRGVIKLNCIKNSIILAVFLIIGSNVAFADMHFMHHNLSRALLRYSSLGYEVFETPGFRGNFIEDGVYNLNGMEVLSSGNGGGVVICIAEMDKMITPIAFLYTDERMKRGVRLSGKARFLGIRVFTSSIGDEKHLPSFELMQ